MQLIPLFNLTDNENLFTGVFLLQYNEIDWLNCNLIYFLIFHWLQFLKNKSFFFFFFFSPQKTTPSSFASFVYDAVWVYALALNTLLESDPSSVKHLHSDENTRFVKW